LLIAAPGFPLSRERTEGEVSSHRKNQPARPWARRLLFGGVFMGYIDPRYLEHQRQRFTRNNARLYIRQDVERFFSARLLPGGTQADLSEKRHAAGQSAEEFLTARFGYKTGREAFRPDRNSEPYLRDTYEVGVLIEHDRRIGRGYRVYTAYPRNSDPR
jgi:hypothetical protein